MGFESLLPSPLPPSAGGTGSSLGVPVLQAATPLAGFALQNATPNILTWTAPADGKLHRVTIYATLSVTVLQVGGAVQFSFTAPDGDVSTPQQIYPGGLNINSHVAAEMTSVVIGAGTTVTVSQSSAQTSGAAVLWAEIWGS